MRIGAGTMLGQSRSILGSDLSPRKATGAGRESLRGRRTTWHHDAPGNLDHRGDFCGEA